MALAPLARTLILFEGGINAIPSTRITVPAPSPILAALTLSASVVQENSTPGTVIGSILGKTAGSTLALVDNAGGRFALGGSGENRTIVAGATGTNYEMATSHGIMLRETPAGATNPSRDTARTITVTNVNEQPNLAELGFSATSFTIGAPAAGAITGATAGSTISATGLPSGLTINGPARTWSWSGSGSSGASSITLTETLADSANSPRESVVDVTMAESMVQPSFSGNPTILSDGTPQAGESLTIIPPSVQNQGGASVLYRWFRVAQQLPVATGANYTVPLGAEDDYVGEVRLTNGSTIFDTKTVSVTVAEGQAAAAPIVFDPAKRSTYGNPSGAGDISQDGKTMTMRVVDGASLRCGVDQVQAAKVGYVEFELVRDPTTANPMVGVVRPDLGFTTPGPLSHAGTFGSAAYFNTSGIAIFTNGQYLTDLPGLTDGQKFGWIVYAPTNRAWFVHPNGQFYPDAPTFDVNGDLLTGAGWPTGVTSYVAGASLHNGDALTVNGNGPFVRSLPEHVSAYSGVVAGAGGATEYTFTAQPTVSGTRSVGNQLTINSGTLSKPLGGNTMETRFKRKGLAYPAGDTLTPTKPGDYVAEQVVFDANRNILGRSEDVPITVTGTEAGSAITSDQAARFLHQATLGATDASIASVRSLGYEGWIDQQLATPLGKTVWDRMGERKPSVYEVVNQVDVFDDAVWDLLIAGEPQLSWRGALALYDMIPIGLLGLVTNWQNLDLANHIDLLRKAAFGNFRTLLTDITYSVAMGNWLTYINNRKANYTPGVSSNPDENYAREILQLFTIGLYQLNMDGTVKVDGNGKPLETYTQPDIVQLARIFTGLVISQANSSEVARTPMTMFAPYNETGASTVLGTVVDVGGGNAAITAALDIIFNHDSLPPYVSKQMIQRMVHSNPSPAYVGRVAAVFANNGQGVRGDMKAVLKAVLMDTEARNLTSNGRLRPPVQCLTAFARLTGMAAPFNFGNTSSTVSGIGQSTGQSPSVFNFFRFNYSPPSSAISAAGEVAPEFQVHNEQTAVAWLNYVKPLIDAGSSTFNLHELDTKLCGGQMSAETGAKIQEIVDGIVSPTDRIKAGILASLVAPEFKVIV